ncbi:MAG: tRNA 2-thiocytidine(32) synthetase TtcA [Clostridiales bacterium]|nr:MAG: tRNA 2-thiocytidine(32) synthetase TtcA [Clostridiales bacterium]HJA31531.1 tRNA 2-thiocytidine(32) synthetase TtcA [Candidatus Eisenbergiella pullicola]
MKLQQVLSYVRRAVDDYHMIQEGDKIAVGISGGKDSLAMLYALHGLQRFYPQHFTIHAVTVDLGFGNLDLSRIEEICRTLEVPYTIVRTQIADIVFNQRKESNPCALCAKMRKGALNDAIKAAGCNKVAYAHHQDDVVETMLMSLIFEGRFHTFAPVTWLDRMELTVIRPMLYMKEADIIGFIHKNDIPVVKSPCPADGHTKREYTKQLLRQLNLENPGVKERMFTAIQTGNLKGWPAVDHQGKGMHKKEGSENG